MTPEMIAEAAELREEHGWKIWKIARRLEISESAVSWHLLRIGADSPKCAVRILPQTAPGPRIHMRGGRIVRRFTPAEDDLLLQKEAEGLGHVAIGNAFKPPRGANTVAARLMTLARHQARWEAAAAAQSRRAAGAGAAAP
jgi:hypothetical protein